MNLTSITLGAVRTDALSVSLRSETIAKVTTLLKPALKMWKTNLLHFSPAFPEIRTVEYSGKHPGWWCCLSSCETGHKWLEITSRTRVTEISTNRADRVSTDSWPKTFRRVVKIIQSANNFVQPNISLSSEDSISQLCDFGAFMVVCFFQNYKYNKIYALGWCKKYPILDMT